MTHQPHQPESDRPAAAPSPDVAPAPVRSSRRQFVQQAARKAAYIAPVVVTLAASRTAFASGASGVS